ncbi:MAG: CoA-binding protein [Proteobacteria bacterium]|nr:CoA-binding protein [Pseudomonadota bacterium]
MRRFFHPDGIAVFGVSDEPRNLARNIIHNCRDLGYPGPIFPVGRKPGRVLGLDIITDPGDLPEGIDLAVILVPAVAVADVIEHCGQKGIKRAVISTGGFAEFKNRDNEAEAKLLAAARRHGIRFIGPNCIGAICTQSGLCTPFNPMQPQSYKKGRISLIVQSGGVTTQSAYYFSEEHLGFSKIISAGNKLDLTECDFLEYLIEDEDTDQIHMYLESIDDGRRFMDLAARSPKPVVLFKSNKGRTASRVAQSHTAALSNNDRIVGGALKQAGIVRVPDIHDMTVCAKALQLPPLRGDRLVALSVSGGISVILGDACEDFGFECPELPRDLIERIESHRRGGVIRMSNPMDFGDVHSREALIMAVEGCLALDDIDGLVLSLMYSPVVARMMDRGMEDRSLLLDFFKAIGEKHDKPIALSFFAERTDIEEFKRIGAFPVFNDAVESVKALSLLRHYWRGRENRLNGTEAGLIARAGAVPL